MKRYETEFEPTETQDFIASKIAGKTVTVKIIKDEGDAQSVETVEKEASIRNIYTDDKELFLATSYTETFTNGEKTSENVETSERIASLDEVENLYLPQDQQNVLTEDDSVEVNDAGGNVAN